MPGWSLTHCVAKDKLGFFFISCLHLQSAEISGVQPHTWFCVALETESRALCVLGSHSTK